MVSASGLFACPHGWAYLHTNMYPTLTHAYALVHAHTHTCVHTQKKRLLWWQVYGMTMTNVVYMRTMRIEEGWLQGASWRTIVWSSHLAGKGEILVVRYWGLVKETKTCKEILEWGHLITEKANHYIKEDTLRTPPNQVKSPTFLVRACDTFGHSHGLVSHLLNEAATLWAVKYFKH